jgi:hypothetical protein
LARALTALLSDHQQQAQDYRWGLTASARSARWPACAMHIVRVNRYRGERTGYVVMASTANR